MLMHIYILCVCVCVYAFSTPDVHIYFFVMCIVRRPRFKAGTLQLRSQVRKSLESLILTATSGATFSVLFVSALLLKTIPLKFKRRGNELC